MKPINRQTISTVKKRFAYKYPSIKKFSKKIEQRLITMINKEEDEDNEQSVWPFAFSGKLKLS